MKIHREIGIVKIQRADYSEKMILWKTCSRLSVNAITFQKSPRAPALGNILMDKIVADMRKRNKKAADAVLKYEYTQR